MSMHPIISTFTNGHDTPRTLLVSARNFRPSVCRTSQNEYEDVVTSVESVDMVSPLPQGTRLGANGRRFFERVTKKLKVDFSRKPRPQFVDLGDRKYDLLFIVVQHPSDLDVLDALPGWRERCKKAVVYVEELWSTDLVYEKMLRLMQPFDAVLCNCFETLAPLQKLLNVPCIWDGIGVDAHRFCPFPIRPTRCIDFFSVGRRGEETHKALLEMSRTRDFFYVYDTAGVGRVMDHRTHRELLAARVKRSRYFLANKPKVNQTEHRGQQEEIGMRYYEGAAGGAIMIGETPNSPRYADHFGWEDSSIRFPYNGTDIAAFLADLDRQPQRLERARIENVVQSLHRHDWVYRYKKILEVAELPALPAAQVRVDKLHSLADLARASEPVKAMVA